MASAPSWAKVMPPSGAATNAAPSPTRRRASAPGISGLRSQQRDPEQGAALEPRARPVARIAVERVQALEDGEDRAGAELVAPRQRPERIVQTQRHREI